jgi:hypothetical protein
MGTPLLANFLGVLAEKLTAYFLDKKARLGKRGNILRALLVIVCAASTFAMGAGEPTPAQSTSTPSTYAFTPESIIDQISGAVMSKLTELENNSRLQGFGQLLTAFFLVAMLVWTSIKTMTGARGIGELIGEWVPIFVGFGIVSMFLDKAAGNLIVSTMDSIGAAVGGTDMSTLSGAIRAGAEPIFKAIAAVVDQPRVTSASTTTWDLAGIAGTVAAALGSIIMMALTKIVTCFILVAAAVVMAAHIIMGFISVRLVLALAPVMVPFLMFRPMSWLFDSWLKFLLGACMLKIVVAFLLNIAAGLLSGMSLLAQRYVTEMQGAKPMETLYVDVLLFGLMMVFALLAMLLLMQAPSIATGLLSGSAGSVGFGGIRGVTQGVAGRVTAGAVGGVGAGAGSAALQTGKNFFAARAGAADGKAGLPSSLKYRDPKAKAAYAQSYRANAPPKPAAAAQSATP